MEKLEDNTAVWLLKVLTAMAAPTLLQNLTIGSLVLRDYDTYMAQAGDTVNVPIMPILSSHTNALPIGNAQVVLNRHMEASFSIPDMTECLANPKRLEIYLAPALLALAQSIDGDLARLWSGFTSNLPISAAALTEGVIDDAETALYLAKIPLAEPKFILADTSMYRQARQSPRFDDETGNFKGLRVVRSLAVVKDLAPPVTHGIAFAGAAMGLISRRPPPRPSDYPGKEFVEGHSELADIGLRVRLYPDPAVLHQSGSVECLYGVGVLREKFGLQINVSAAEQQKAA